ncbi:hypothetical protein [Geodermatophilus sp. FMUSA9-8]|uniref:hypothetical protein n=1 Tax=Geodermatophilus sp. FMUSA9-8 TaxID=3120155 RepID=UPI00300B5032
MSREIPEPVRASVGLAATVLDDVRSLPATLPGLPVRLVGLALQAAMKLQQHWSGLVARGDEVLTGLRGDREPGMATFDDDEDERSGEALVAQPIDVLRTSAFDRAPDVDTTGISDAEVAELPEDPAADAVVAAVEDTAAVLDETETLTEVDVMEIDVDTDAAGLVDDEMAGLPQDPPPAAVVAAVEDVTDQVLGTEEAEAALDAADSALTAEDALESALLEAEGSDSPAVPAVPDDAPAASDPGGSPVGELAGAPDVGSDDAATPDAADSGTPDTEIGTADDADTGTAASPDAGVLGEDAESDAAAAEDAATEVDVLTPDGQVTTVEGTVTDEGVVAPEDGGEQAADGQGTATGEASDVVTGEHARVDEELGAEAGPGEDSGAATDTVEPEPLTDTATDTATDEGGTPVAAATGVRTDVGDADTAEEDAAIAEGAAVDAVGGESDAPTDDPEGGSELSGSQAAGAAPVDGYDSFTVAQLRGRLRGYQLATVGDLLAYEEATRNRAPFVTMLRNRLEKLEQQAADASPLQPRG